ncbi:hypothetical protein ACQPT2_21190 [Erwinia amylovora]
MTSINNPVSMSLMAIMAVAGLYIVWRAGMRVARFVRLLMLMRRI